MISSSKIRIFVLPIILSTLEKIITLLLLLVPIQALRSVSRGVIGRKFKVFFDIAGLEMPAPNETIFFFTKLFIFLILLMLLIKKLKIFSTKYLSKKIITPIIEEYIKSKGIKDSRLEVNLNKIIKQKDKEIESQITILSTGVFCISLFSGIFFIDFQIGLLILTGGLVNYGVFDFLNNKKQILEKKSFTNASLVDFEKNYTDNDYNFDSEFINNYIGERVDKTFAETKSFLKHFVNSLIILSIMFLLYSRSDSTISIIFIILIRLYLNQLNKGVQRLVRYRKNSLDNNSEEDDLV